MRILNLWIGVALILISSTLFAADEAASDQVKIGELNEAYVTSLNSQDAKAIGCNRLSAGLIWWLTKSG